MSTIDDLIGNRETLSNGELLQQHAVEGAKNEESAKRYAGTITSMVENHNTKLIRAASLLLRTSVSKDLGNAMDEWEVVHVNDKPGLRCNLCNRDELLSSVTLVNKKDRSRMIVTGKDCNNTLAHTLYMIKDGEYRDMPTDEELRRIAGRKREIEQKASSGGLAEIVSKFSDSVKESALKILNLPAEIVGALAYAIDSMNILPLGNSAPSDAIPYESQHVYDKKGSLSTPDFLEREFQKGNLPAYVAEAWIKANKKVLRMDEVDWAVCYLYDAAFNNTHSKAALVGSVIEDIETYNNLATRDEQLKERFGAIETEGITELLVPQKTTITRFDAAKILMLKAKGGEEGEREILNLRAALNHEYMMRFKKEKIEDDLIDKILPLFDSETREWSSSFKENWKYNPIMNRDDRDAMKSFINVSTITNRDWRANCKKAYSIKEFRNIFNHLITIKRKMIWQDYKDSQREDAAKIIKEKKFWLIEDLNSAINEGVEEKDRIPEDSASIVGKIRGSYIADINSHRSDNTIDKAREFLKDVYSFGLFNKSKQNLEKIREIYERAKDMEEYDKEKLAKIADFQNHPLMTLTLGPKMKMPQFSDKFSESPIRYFNKEGITLLDKAYDSIEQAKTRFSNLDKAKAKQDLDFIVKAQAKDTRYISWNENDKWFVNTILWLEEEKEREYVGAFSFIPCSRLRKKFSDSYVLYDSSVKEKIKVIANKENDGEIKKQGLRIPFRAFKYLLSGAFTSSNAFYFKREAYDLIDRTYKQLKDFKFQPRENSTELLDKESKNVLREAEKNGYTIKITTRYAAERDKYILKSYGLTDYKAADKTCTMHRVNPHSDVLESLQQKIADYNARTERKKKVGLKIEIEP